MESLSGQVLDRSEEEREQIAATDCLIALRIAS